MLHPTKVAAHLASNVAPGVLASPPYVMSRERVK